MRYELIPIDGRKSFYGKAIIDLQDDGTATLYSYGTKIISKNRDGLLTRYYNGYTATTGRHIKAFCGLNKTEFLKLIIEA